jgi:uncharacterized protein
MKYIFFLTLLLSPFMFSQDMSNMREYYFVELLRIPNRPTLDSTVSANLQAAHLNNIDSLHRAGKLVLAGPFGDDKGGGIFILKASSLEEATEMCESDPAIKNGRLNYKVRTWWSDKTMFTSEK